MRVKERGQRALVNLTYITSILKFLTGLLFINLFIGLLCIRAYIYSVVNSYFGDIWLPRDRVAAGADIGQVVAHTDDLIPIFINELTINCAG